MQCCEKCARCDDDITLGNFTGAKKIFLFQLFVINVFSWETSSVEKCELNYISRYKNPGETFKMAVKTGCNLEVWKLIIREMQTFLAKAVPFTKPTAEKMSRSICG